jgi:hypothetical protein
LEKSYAIVYLDALRVKSREEGKSCNKSVYVVLGVSVKTTTSTVLNKPVLNFREIPVFGG